MPSGRYLRHVVFEKYRHAFITGSIKMLPYSDRSGVPALSLRNQRTCRPEAFYPVFDHAALRTGNDRFLLRADLYTGLFVRRIFLPER